MVQASVVFSSDLRRLDSQAPVEQLAPSLRFASLAPIVESLAHVAEDAEALDYAFEQDEWRQLE